MLRDAAFSSRGRNASQRPAVRFGLMTGPSHPRLLALLLRRMGSSLPCALGWREGARVARRVCVAHEQERYQPW